MRIELYAIQYGPSASQETAFYSADLHVVGVRIGAVSNANSCSGGSNGSRSSTTLSRRPRNCRGASPVPTRTSCDGPGAQ